MPKDRFLIAIDLDGSLLTDDKKITERTKHALQKARQQGHQVVIATGRPFRASKQFYHELGLTTPIVNFNGAYVHHPLKKDWTAFHSPLDISTARSVIETSEQVGVQNIMIEVIDDVYVREHKGSTINDFYDQQTNISVLPKQLHREPTSLLIHPYPHNVARLRQHLEENHAEVIDHRKWGAPWHVIEIIRSGLNKAVGLKHVCNYFNIPAQNVIAFGDEDNDLEMLQFAGTGVAMGNAIKPLKEIANVVTSANEEDGIAKFLEKEVL